VRSRSTPKEQSPPRAESPPRAADNSPPAKMVSFRSLMGALPLVLPLADAAALHPRQGAATRVSNARSIEGIAVRANGQILATNMNSGSLITVDASTGTQGAIAITGARGLAAIDEYAPDKFAVVGGKGIYSLDFSAGSTPTQKLVATITEANNLNGLTTFNNMTVLVGDAGAGKVFKVNLQSGAYEVALQDATMAPGSGIPFGIDGVRYKDGVVWYTNIFKNTFHRVPVDASAKATGPYETLWTNLMGDDMCFGPDGKLYLATNSRNSVVRVDPANAKTSTVVGQVSGSTSCDFGQTEATKNTVYVGGGQGIFSITI
jgi:sugar lactone lactonase YvrE